MVVAIFGIISTDSLWNGIASPSRARKEIKSNDSAQIRWEAYRVTRDRLLPGALVRRLTLRANQRSVLFHGRISSLYLYSSASIRKQSLACEQRPIRSYVRYPCRKACLLAHRQYSLRPASEISRRQFEGVSERTCYTGTCYVHLTERPHRSALPLGSLRETASNP